MSSQIYTGPRPILAGQNVNNWTGPRGNVGRYSNYSLRGTGPDVFTGFPDRQYVLGTYKQARILEYIYAGGQHIAPMKDPGSGARLAYHRYHPYENKASGGALVFTPGFGHQDRVTAYSAYNNFYYDGLPAIEPMKNPGHLRRFGISYGGAFDPLVNKGTQAAPLASTVANPLPTGYNNLYGKNKINEWRGVPSSRAL